MAPPEESAFRVRSNYRLKNNTHIRRATGRAAPTSYAIARSDEIYPKRLLIMDDLTVGMDSHYRLETLPVNGY